MTRPEEPVGGRAMPPPADPWATIDRPAPTVYFGDDPDATATISPQNRPGLNPTVHLPGTQPAAHSPGSNPGAQAGPAAHAVHRDAPAPTVRVDGEMRFGPGVPIAPVAAPGWPAATPAGRPRPVWRRLVSVLSSLLTLALIGVVGLYIWQRLSPLEIEGVTVAVPQPAGSRCDVTIDVIATVRTNGRSGAIRYQWFRSDAPPGAVLTEQVGRGQSVATLTLRWTFSGVGSTSETATVNILEPSPIQSGTPVTYRCRRG
uniref:hypothetical protein n=1 Tax=Paractinoplanes polyasparticus TaxID=2856853 RepID=UPI0027E07EFA|nr:hypothetical protein [Actinoplanes polyasparticus]